MIKCSFCGEQIEKGTGKIYVEAKGTVLNFCSSKCEKNMLKLGRKARNVEWTGEAKANKLAKKGE
jgi:large subunit ribosomal protein L24e